ncbi:macro domain-containing protein [Roseimicrobium sp. ORNL1]|uniref:macro domain-containing protein n=1 Tax=Roseimicrobium sp. ORNL1 TaxID=2711231 RepID=UPI0013E0F691|nr:phosphatase [Roseimicrobium sp. ORNL1]
MREAHGDLIQMALAGEFDVVVHGCNCFCTMGAGIAKQIKATFPAAYRSDCRTPKGDRNKLGTYSSAKVNDLTIVNAYTQHHWQGSGQKADYDAIRSCLTKVAADFPNARIGLPQIGAGLAGGDWKTILQIIREELGDTDTTVVYYQPPPNLSTRSEDHSHP